jgi:hypothetical protein
MTTFMLDKKIQLSLKNDILVVNFKGDKLLMNKILDPISNNYEGIIVNREGHNFPSTFIPKNHPLYKFKDKCKYVIGVYHHNSLSHELLHAKFFIDQKYKQNIINEWEQLEPHIRKHIHSFLKKMGYQDNVIIDEYQAYRYTEKNNFFGIKL